MDASMVFKRRNYNSVSGIGIGWSLFQLEDPLDYEWEVKPSKQEQKRFFAEVQTERKNIKE